MNLEPILGFTLGLIANELCDVSPWLAHKIIRWAVRHKYLDRKRAEIRAEELAAVINDRPGKLFKLLSALSFAIGTVCALTHRGMLRIWLSCILAFSRVELASWNQASLGEASPATYILNSKAFRELVSRLTPQMMRDLAARLREVADSVEAGDLSSAEIRIDDGDTSLVITVTADEALA